MPYFKFEQLFDLGFSGSFSYILPESVKQMLVELESCLEITDSVASDTVERKEYNKSSDSRRFVGSEHGTGIVKYRNRYDFDSASASASSGKDRDRDRDRKKKDFRQKDVGTSEWRAGSSSGASGQDTSDADWEMMRSFKATKIESKTGIEKTVNDVRIALNKISAANYDKQRDVVMNLVNGYFESGDEMTEANTRRISKAIFDIASTNKFYSEMYAKLYKELVDSHGVFRDLLEELVVMFMEMDTIPIYVDPDSDYDGFCAYSKACEIRKSTSTFIVNCLKLDLIGAERVAEVLSKFIEYVDSKRSEEGFAKCVEEIVENIYIIATLCTSELSKTDKWNEYILPRIKYFVAEKNGRLPSMSNRATFKFLDLLEKIC